MYVFFFSSRRRHTRYWRDWSSDVCSSDLDAFVHAANAIAPYYRNVEFCFLELDLPNIEDGIGRAVAGDPQVILIVPYFLHRGAHIKRDVIKDLNAALDKYNFKNAHMGQHLGVDEKLVDIIIERAREVEKRFGL